MRAPAPAPAGLGSNDPVGLGRELKGGRWEPQPSSLAPSQPHTVQPHGPRRRRAALGPAAESGAPGGGGRRPDFDRDAAGQFPLRGPYDPQLQNHRPDHSGRCIPEDEGDNGG